MLRVQFSDSSNGVSPWTVLLNPIDMNLIDSDDYNLFNPLDGSPIKDKKYFDSRPKQLFWTRLPDNLNGIGTFISTLKSYEGQTKYVNFNDIDYRTSGTGWNKFIVDRADVSIEEGGQIKYNITLYLIPRQ